jgi:broad specificity phosphatase PhoE
MVPLLTVTSAGSRDSDLTNHGFQQATRLGRFFHSTGVELSHVFSSHLKRAVNTAELIASAQSSFTKHNSAAVQLKQVTLLTEQDFGSYEGKSFASRPSGSSKNGKEAHREIHKDDPGFVDVESKKSMALRADTFLDEHLFALLNQPQANSGIAIVSHGIFLSVLWRRLLLRLPPKSVTFRSELLATYGSLDLERLGGWSNTGYLEVEMLQSVAPGLPTEESLAADANTIKIDVAFVAAVPLDEEAISNTSSTVQLKTASTAIVLTGWTTSILAVNSKSHLVGLKRTGGGVGSSRHDDKQKSIESFFKRRKVG